MMSIVFRLIAWAAQGRGRRGHFLNQGEKCNGYQHNLYGKSFWGQIHICKDLIFLYVFSTLAWKIPWAEEPGRLQSMGSLRVRHD